MNRGLLLVVSVGLILALACAALADEKIENYTFDWRVASSGESRLIVQKTDESTAVVIQRKGSMVRLSPRDAVSVGEALKGADAAFGESGGSNFEKTVKVGKDTRIRFVRDDRNAYVAISTGLFGSVVMPRGEAKEIAKKLLISDKLCADVDRRLRL